MPTSRVLCFRGLFVPLRDVSAAGRRIDRRVRVREAAREFVDFPLLVIGEFQVVTNGRIRDKGEDAYRLHERRSRRDELPLFLSPQRRPPRGQYERKCQCPHYQSPVALPRELPHDFLLKNFVRICGRPQYNAIVCKNPPCK